MSCITYRRLNIQSVMQWLLAASALFFCIGLAHATLNTDMLRIEQWLTLTDSGNQKVKVKFSFAAGANPPEATSITSSVQKVLTGTEVKVPSPKKIGFDFVMLPTVTVGTLLPAGADAAEFPPLLTIAYTLLFYQEPQLSSQQTKRLSKEARSEFISQSHLEVCLLESQTQIKIVGPCITGAAITQSRGFETTILIKLIKNTGTPNHPYSAEFKLQHLKDDTRRDISYSLSGSSSDIPFLSATLMTTPQQYIESTGASSEQVAVSGHQQNDTPAVLPVSEPTPPPSPPPGTVKIQPTLQPAPPVQTTETVHGSEVTGSRWSFIPCCQ
ncbi:hypothetical protein [Spongorhabdus nitratireducens]